MNTTLYPEITPNREGMLDVGDGNKIYWEESGNPQGKPVVFLHGGPGAGTVSDHRRLFNPEKYRIVLFDQRGCGKSTPHLSSIEADLSTNTTWHLVADIEKLREYLNIDKWQVFGGSWGSTLALAYAQTHPDRVSELVLRGIFTLRQAEVDWFYQFGASEVFPDFWEEYLAPVPMHKRNNIVKAYAELLANPNPEVHIPAAVAWTAWESSTIKLHPDYDGIARLKEDKAASVAFARIENHYCVNGGWFDEGQLIANVHKIRHIPAVIIQGRYDMCTPIRTAFDLHKAWPEAEYVVVPEAGHAFSESGISAALILATNKFAGIKV